MTLLARKASSVPRPLRAAVVLVLLLATMVPFVDEARAATKIPADRSAWFWMSNEKVTVEDVAGQVAPGVSIGGGAYGNTGANPISPGHLGVAMRNGQPDMRAYIHFKSTKLVNGLPVPIIPPGATVNSFVAKLTLSPRTTAHSEEHSTNRGRSPATLNDANAAVMACLMRESWGDNVRGGGGGDPPASTTVEDPTVTPTEPPGVRTQQNEPLADCSVNVMGERTKDGTAFTFDLTEMAQMWANGELINEGVALIPVENSINPTWILEFHGPRLTLDTDTGTAPVVPENLAAFATADFTGGLLPPPPPPPPTSVDPGGAVTFPTFGNPTPPANGSSEAPPVTTTPPTTTRPFVPIAFTAPTPLWFFALFALGLAALWWLRSMVGSDPLGLTAAAATNNVANVLQHRRLAGGETVTAAEAMKEQEIAQPEQP